MRILFLLQSFPFPPAEGGLVKVFNILKYLSVEHDCDLICFGDGDHVDIAGLRREVPSIGTITIVPKPNWIVRILGVFTNLVRLRPPSFARYSSRVMVRCIKEAMQRKCYDVIHFDVINMAQYQRHCQALASVHSPNDATSFVYKRFSECAPNFFLKLHFLFVSFLLARYERQYYSDFTKVHVVSDMDHEYLTCLVPAADIMVIPIISGYSLEPSFSHSARKANRDFVVTVCGNLDNPGIRVGVRAFLEEVMPLVLLEHPSLRVRILGRCSSTALRCKLDNAPNIEYVDRVDNFDAFLVDTDVVLLPDRTGAPGAKTRTIQSMALGLPVLGTTNAFEGIQMVNARHGAVYTNNDDCRDWLLRLLGNSDLRKMLGEFAARFAAEKYSIEIVGPQYEQLYREALEHGAIQRET